MGAPVLIFRCCPAASNQLIEKEYNDHVEQINAQNKALTLKNDKNEKILDELESSCVALSKALGESNKNQSADYLQLDSNEKSKLEQCSDMLKVVKETVTTFTTTKSAVE